MCLSADTVQLNRDKILYYILSQIIYPQIDTPKKDKYECYYDYCDKNDDVYLRWLDGKPVGFYTIKHKGTEIISCEKIYQMNTIDTAYIRSEYRNQGLGIEILHDVIKHYQDQDIGFSKPISDGMFQVLKKFLIKQKEYRLRFWEIEDGGTEGSAKLVWFILKKHFKN
ncbi:protein FAM169B-like [Aphidius gifuensis]|uniref:protein FAM169B-like n=1 Tax=Aphidius gifuensis TaxID=684658 RepID=UPI001CDD055F|nr:protein FAM169B-like [Aphidius gifuensis]